MDKIVVITGSSQGLGAALKQLFTAAGDTVVGLCRHPQENDIYCDVSDEAQVNAAFDRIAERYGRVDLLVNNAGLGISGATELLPTAEAQYVIDVDYNGTYYCCRAALKSMRRGGKIVNISSACALFALPYRAVYCAAKAAVNMLSYGLRMELKPHGIDVVTVCPGDVKTSFTANRKKIVEGGRYGDAPVRAAEKLDAREHKRMDCGKVARRLYKICRHKRGAMYIVGGKYKFLWFMKRILPTNFFLKATRRFFG